MHNKTLLSRTHSLYDRVANYMSAPHCLKFLPGVKALLWMLRDLARNHIEIMGRLEEVENFIIRDDEDWWKTMSERYQEELEKENGR